jgi:SAM-dependent methyltransferase
VTKSFFRSDGQALRVIEGFRDRVLSYRASVSPRPGWTERDFAASADRKRKRFRRLLDSFARFVPTIDGARVLDVGCGDGINCILLAAEPVRLVVGIDLHPRLFAPGAEGQQMKTLLEQVVGPAAEGSLPNRPVCFARMDATRMAFRRESFDVVLSRSAAEHIQPIERALAEIARVVRRGGFVYLGIDPFFWLRGCHKRGLVDIPFAHARLPLPEYRRFVADSEGTKTAEMRCRRLETLNRLTVRQWRRTIESQPWDVLDWKDAPSELGATVLRENPDILDTLLPGIDEHELLTERIEVCLRTG